MEDWSLVVELLESYDQNCREVERQARRQIHSIEVPVFNGLRDMFAFNVVSALRRMEHWFGKIPTLEHAFCLVVLTDYISCAYNQRNFYRTFENALTEKFIDSLFEKLLEEWTKVFSSRPPLIHFTDDQMKCIWKSLLRSANRFSASFRHKISMHSIVKLCESYEEALRSTENLQNVSDNLPKKQLPQVTSGKLLREDKDGLMDVDSWVKKKATADMTKNIVRQKVSPAVVTRVDPTPKVEIGSPVGNHIPVKKVTSSGSVLVPTPRKIEVASKLNQSSHEKSSPLVSNNKSIPQAREQKITRSIPQVREDKIKVNNNNGDSTRIIAGKEVVSACGCCSTKTNISDIKVPVVTAPKRTLNAFDILMRKVAPPKRQRLF